jgi:hypothetical protein
LSHLVKSKTLNKTKLIYELDYKVSFSQPLLFGMLLSGEVNASAKAIFDELEASSKVRYPEGVLKGVGLDYKVPILYALFCCDLVINKHALRTRNRRKTKMLPPTDSSRSMTSSH